MGAKSRSKKKASVCSLIYGPMGRFIHITQSGWAAKYDVLKTRENLEQVCIEKHWYISRHLDLLTPLRWSESDYNRIPKGTSGQLARARFHSMYSVSKTPVHPSAWSLVRKRRLVEVLVGVGEGVVGVGCDFLLAGREVSTTRYTIPSLPCFMQHYFRLVNSEGIEVYTIEKITWVLRFSHFKYDQI